MRNYLLLSFFTIFHLAMQSQTLAERSVYTSNLNKSQITALKAQFESERNKLLQNISKYNFPLSYFDDKNRFNHLQGVTDAGIPIYYRTDNNGSGVTIKASRLYSGGGLGLNVQGQNMIAGVWDGGATRLDHDHFQNRVTQKDFSSMSLSSHATHVAGTVCQNKTTVPISRGIAFNSEVWASDWTNDLAEVSDAAAEGLLVSNHSYGFSVLNGSNNLTVPLYFFGAYIQLTRNWDLLMNQFPNYLMITSAGNDRDSQAFITNKGGYDLLSGMKTCKNNITVAAINNIQNYVDASSAVMSNFSNWGPTDDSRIKPDLAAKGVSVSSTTSTGSTSATTTMSGTSMAAPAVTGGLLLLQQHYKNVAGNYMLGATLKGLALHSTSEAGFNEGPDYEFGWGVLNCETAANIISTRTTSSRIQELTLNPGQTMTINITAITSTLNPLMASICWNDPAGAVAGTTVDNPTPSLVNDLDLKVTKGAVNFFPWKLTAADPAAAATKGINNVDPFEKVQVDNPVGNYSIVISHKGTLAAAQKFSLILSGVSLVLSNDNFEESNTVSIYPNPTNGILNIETDVNKSISAVSVFDITGKEMQIKNVQNQVDVSNLQSGVYFIKFSIDDKMYMKKFIKN